MSRAPTITFNNGQTFPIFGLGTWKSKPGEVTQAVKDAIDVGYRHIDCAHLYGNETEVGEAIQAKIAEGVVKREDLYITSKLWCNALDPELVEPALRVTLRHLGLDYLDLYLIHWPVAFQGGPDLYPVDTSGKFIFGKTDYVDTWKALEAVCRKGLTKSIGVSNFNRRQIERILANASIIPVTNQIECHPYLNQKKLIDYCTSKGIRITAYSPLGLRYQVQRGNITIPKSVNKSRIRENFDIWDFQLSPEDTAYLDTFDCNGRVCHFVEALGHPNHPFDKGDDY